jgi:hypothetical protein
MTIKSLGCNSSKACEFVYRPYRRRSAFALRYCRRRIEDPVHRPPGDLASEVVVWLFSGEFVKFLL